MRGLNHTCLWTPALDRKYDGLYGSTVEVQAESLQDLEQALCDEDSDICINIISIGMFLQDQFCQNNLYGDLVQEFRFAVNGAVDDTFCMRLRMSGRFFQKIENTTVARDVTISPFRGCV